MHPLLDKYLYDKYPKIFADRHKPMNETCMCWGISTNNGWFSLLNTLCANIQNYIDNPQWVYNEKTKEYEEPKKPTVPQIVADQVKEKFSGLRFYYHGGDEYIRGMVSLAEDLSYYICEECGKMDDSVGRNSNGWIHTSCERHANDDNFSLNGDKELSKIWRKVHEDEKSAEEAKREKGNLIVQEAMFGKTKS